MATDKRINYQDTKPVVQGGVDNYLGKQPQVQAPRKWQSGPGKPPTELAYITQAEKDLILKGDLHGSLKKGPNIGPSGIMSLDSFGDIGGAGASGGDTSAGGGAMAGRGFSGKAPGQSDRDFDRQKANQRAGLQIAERAQAKNLGYNERQDISRFTSRPKSNWGGLGGIGRGIMSIFGGVPGKIASFLSGASKWAGKLRGYNPDGTPKTQQQYEDDRDARINEKRIGNILSRDAPITAMTHNTLGKLGYTGDLPAIGSTAAIRNDPNYLSDMDTGYARTHLQSLANNMEPLNTDITNQDFNTEINPQWSENLWTGAKDGGRIGYNRGRVVNPGGYAGEDEFEDENTLEFMQDQGIPFSEMAETSPFEMRINELMEEGMSWQEAYQIASEEFGQVVEGESDQGLASRV